MRTIVIGAGAAGLCSALMLARYDHEVLLLEAGGRIAPLLRGFTRDGVQCDTGFHQAGALGARGILRKYLAFCGLLEHLDLFPFKEDCYELFRFTGQSPAEDFHMPQGLKKAGRALSARWPEQRENIRDFFQQVERFYNHSPFIDPRRFNAQSLVTPGGTSLREYFSARSMPARLKSLLAAHSIYYGTSPERALLEELALVTRSMLEEVHGITGGGATLAGAFELAAASGGIQTQTGCAALKILTGADNEIKAVRTADGEEIPCNYCIYTGHPAALPELLPEGSLRPAMTRYLRSLEETPDFLLFFGAAKNDFLLGRNLILCPTDDLDLAYKKLGLKTSWMHLSGGTQSVGGEYPVSAVCGIDGEWRRQFAKISSTAPPAGAADGSRRPSGYGELKKRIMDELYTHLRRHAPEISGFRPLELSSPLSMREWVYGSTGSVYGRLHSGDNLPVLPFTRVRNLLLAGQNIVLPGLLGTFISAAVVCGSIIGYKKLFRDLACTNAG